jgi:hypothetical protein
LKAISMSLTKATLLKKAAVSKPDVLGEFFGETVYVKSVSEFQRSRRMASLYDMKKEVVREEAIQRARCATIIDHLCDKDGKNLFADKDMKDLMNLDALKMDLLIAAIEEWVRVREGKLLGK